jgi:hypothetical protein
MRFARIVFTIAGIWGIAVLTPFYWLVDITGRHYQPPTEYPNFFWGFFAVTLAWQIGFLLIGSNPGRYRLFMLPAMVEKLGYVITLTLLYNAGRVAPADATAAIPDGLLGLLFVVAFVLTSKSAVRQPSLT